MSLQPLSDSSDCLPNLFAGLNLFAWQARLATLIKQAGGYLVKKVAGLSVALVLLMQAMGSAVLAQTGEQCLNLVHKLEPEMPKLIDSAAVTIHNLVPSPEEYEKTLPAMSKVTVGKDRLNLKNWGGLSEAYLFAGKRTKAEALYKSFAQASKTVFEPTDTYLAAVEGDFGMVYFMDKNYAKAEPLLLDSIKSMEANLTYAISNNLISNYICMSLIRDKQGKTKEAANYALKYVELAKKQRAKMLPN